MLTWLTKFKKKQWQSSLKKSCKTYECQNIGQPESAILQPPGIYTKYAYMYFNGMLNLCLALNVQIKQTCVKVVIKKIQITFFKSKSVALLLKGDYRNMLVNNQSCDSLL